jgi:hypothetical protein
LKRSVIFIALLLCAIRFALAQTIQVDITPAHSTNHFVPNQTLGAGIDRIPVEAIDKGLSSPILEKVLAAGWQPVTYRQNTELTMEAWHWNPQGSWSDPSGRGYFTGTATPGEPIRYSYGYALPHRGTTRNDGTGNAGFSRLTDGDPKSYWKSNPYLTERFTGESDSLHPQWIIIDLNQNQSIDTIRINWAEPYATHYSLQYWTGDDPIRAPTKGIWQIFPNGVMTAGKGGELTIRLSTVPMVVRYLRILMTESSNTCDTHGAGDPRNCVGFAINEIYIGTTTTDGELHDIIRHTADQEQTTTYASSADSWHAPSDLGPTKQAQVGFDLFYTSGITRGLPAMIPIAMLYGTPEDSAAEIAYLKARNYPISYVEMGEESDGQYFQPEDYGALYLQWATALHRVDPALKLGGPSFQGVNKDIETWPDANGRVSWVRRFLDYMRQHARLNDLAFFSFEHYPYDGCKGNWGSLYEEPDLVTHIMQVWRDDGVLADVPLFITESNMSPPPSETYMDLFAGLWLADYIGSFIGGGGGGVYYFHYLPLVMEHGCNDSSGTFGMFTVGPGFTVEQPLSQFFAAQMINREWVQPGAGEHRMFPAKADIDDGAGHALITVYALKRPDGQWSLMIVNRDQQNSHQVHISFQDQASNASSTFTGPVETATFGSAQYEWHPAKTQFFAHAEHPTEWPVGAYLPGFADPDGPIAHSRQNAGKDTAYDIPAASVVVIRGKIGLH